MLGFWVGIGTLGGGDFFRWYLKIPCIKINSEYKSEAKKKKKKKADLVIPKKNLISGWTCKVLDSGYRNSVTCIS